MKQTTLIDYVLQYSISKKKRFFSPKLNFRFMCTSFPRKTNGNQFSLYIGWP